MTAFGQRLVGHRVDRITEALEAIEGEALRTVSEAQPAVWIGTEAPSPLVTNLLELRSALADWRRRLTESRSTATTLARLQRNARRSPR